MMTPTEAFAAATRHHQAGQFAEAERLYEQVLAAEPGHLHALVLSGVLAHMGGRNERAVDLFGRALAINEQPDFHYNVGLAKWALGRRDEAVTHWRRTLALNPDFAQAHMNLGNALREEDKLDEAVTHLRRALQLQPSPFAHNNLGLALAAQNNAEGAAHYQRAIAMYPEFIEPYLNLTLELARSGRTNEALACVRRSLSIKETPENTALFTRMVGMLDAVADDPALRALVTRAATENWGHVGDLSGVATTLVNLHLLDPKDPLLRWLLESVVICDFDLEKSLTAARTRLLDIAETTPDPGQDQLVFACALARQCFANEYVYWITAEEHARVARLREAAPTPFRLAVLGTYAPLAALPEGPQPAPLDAVLTQQVREPRQQTAMRATIPHLTPIDDPVSRAVQAMYEENPYPRWIAAGSSPVRYDSVDALMREFPRAPCRRTGKSDLDVLVAGCGTGRHSIEVARQFPSAAVTAIDLSTASLAYAATQARALGVTNVTHMQADILRLGSIDKAFDMIQVSGVLHHLADPWAGWRVLLSLLRPGGVMYLGLYSELARRDVVAAREFIAQHGFGSTAEDIRACRQALMAQPEGSPLRKVERFNDFFTTSECRDLLFHVQEGRMTLPQIKQFISQNELAFLGFALEPNTAQRYATRFPDDPAMIDLDHWDAFERESPYTFASMYRFWVRKAG